MFAEAVDLGIVWIVMSVVALSVSLPFKDLRPVRIFAVLLICLGVAAVVVAQLRH